MKFKIIIFAALLLIANAGIFAQKAESNIKPLQVGAIAPDFTLTDSNGEKSVTLSKVNKPTVLVFYRGYW